MSYFGDIYKGIKTLLTGMSITGKYFLTSRKGAITQQYPDNRATLKMFDRFRGEVIMPHDENNQHKCTGCQSCEIACPNGSIEIIWDRQVDPESGCARGRGVDPLLRGVVVNSANRDREHLQRHARAPSRVRLRRQG